MVGCRWGIPALIGLMTVTGVAGCRQTDRTAPAQPAGVPANGSARAQLQAFWSHAKEVSYKSVEELQAQLAHEQRKGRRDDILARGNPRLRTVALTFDDGPHSAYTPQILAILKRYNVKATFFVVGEKAQAHPDLIRAERDAGHLLGNHTYHHVNLSRIPLLAVATEWQACQDTVKAITGETMHFCRPPGGDYDHDVVTAAMATGLTTVLWTDDPGDYANPGDRTIATRLLDRIGNGGIILIHDGVQETINTLPQTIERVRSRGYTFVTCAELKAGLSQRSPQSARPNPSPPTGH